MTAPRKPNSGLWPLLVALALSTPPPALAAPKADPVMAAAQAHADHAAKLLKSGDAAGALAEYESARRLKASTAFDVGVAKCLEKLGRIDEAVAVYKRVLESLDSQPADADEARARLRAIKTRPPSEAATPAATAKGTDPKGGKPAATAKGTDAPAGKPAATAKGADTPAGKSAATAKGKDPAAKPTNSATASREPVKGPSIPPPESMPTPEPAPGTDEAGEEEPEPEPRAPATGRLAWLLEPRRSFYIGIGVGAGAAVLLGTGIALYLSADGDYARLRFNCTPRCNPGEVDGSRAKEIVGGVILGVGLLAAAADAALWVYRGLGRRERTAWILPTGTGFVAGGRF